MENLIVTDALDRSLGHVRVESVEGDFLMGEFTPGPDYGEVEPIFTRFSEMVEQFSLSFLDQIESKIAELGIRVSSKTSTRPTFVDSVQIYSDGGFSCRLPVAASVANEVETIRGDSIQPVLAHIEFA